MSLSTKALFAALALSITPALASAQGLNFHVIPNIGAPALSNATPGLGVPAPQPAQAREQTCGANRLQVFVGHPLSYEAMSGLNARYFTPDSPYGTMDYRADRLNIETDDHYIITRIYCG